VLAFVEKLVTDLHLGKESVTVKVVVVDFLVLPSLLQIRAIAGAVECDLPLFAAALGTDASVHSGTKSLFLPKIADGATHRLDYFMPRATSVKVAPTLGQAAIGKASTRDKSG
jgi:hypothetical protein